MTIKTVLKSCDNSHSVIEAVLQAETAKAVLIHTCDEDDCWLPKSQIEIVDSWPINETPQQGLGKVIVVHIPNWLVNNNAIV